MDATFNPRNGFADASATERSRASDWLWRPWYAKVWWAAIPIWWLGMAASTRIPVLESFYDSALAGFLNILFFPMTALMVLGVGYVQQWLAHFPTQADGGFLSSEAEAAIAELEEEHARALEARNASMDMYDPRSDGLFVGNPLSEQNPHHRF